MEIEDELHYKNVIGGLIEYIKEKAPKKGLYSLSVVGAFANPNHKIELINDVDILYIYDDVVPYGKRARLSRSINSCIVQLNEEITSKFSNSIEIVPSYECGPFKPPPDGKFKIEVHNIIYTINRWLREEPTFLFDRARLNRLLCGEPPGSISDVKQISKYAVIRDLYGIDHCIHMIKTKCIKYCIWEPDPANDQAMRISVKERDVGNLSNENLFAFMEFLFYSNIRPSVNSVRIITKQAHYYRQDCTRFVRIFKDFDMKELLGEVLDMKHKFRNNRLKINEDMAARLSTQVVLYLEKLKDYLEKIR